MQLHFKFPKNRWNRFRGHFKFCKVAPVDLTNFWNLEFYQCFYVNTVQALGQSIVLQQHSKGGGGLNVAALQESSWNLHVPGKMFGKSERPIVEN